MAPQRHGSNSPQDSKLLRHWHYLRVGFSCSSLRGGCLSTYPIIPIISNHHVPLAKALIAALHATVLYLTCWVCLKLVDTQNRRFKLCSKKRGKRMPGQTLWNPGMPHVWTNPLGLRQFLHPSILNSPGGGLASNLSSMASHPFRRFKGAIEEWKQNRIIIQSTALNPPSQTNGA